MAYARYESVAVNTAGDVIPNATIEVREDRAGRPVVPLWANRDGTEPLGNPIKSDELGKFGFYVKGGSYYIRVFIGPSQQPFQQYVRRHQAIGTAAERDVEELASALETGTATFPTLAELEAFTPSGDGVGGKVYADPVANSNGYYSWDGAAWSWKRPLTDTLARLNVTGGTANAIVASLDPGVDGAHVAMLFIEPTGNNTAPVFINGKEVKTVDGASLLAGQWLAGRTYWFTDEGAFYKLRNESDVSGLVAQAEAAATRALQAETDTSELRDETEVLRDEAAGFAAGLNLPAIVPGDAGKQLVVADDEEGYQLQDPPVGGIPSRAWAIANFHPAGAPESLRTDGYALPGNGGGALYKQVASEPAHAGKFSITLADAVTVVWYELAGERLNIKQFGAIGDGTTDDTAAVQASVTFAAGRPLYAPAGTYLITTAIDCCDPTQLFTYRPGVKIIGEGIGKTKFLNNAEEACFLHMVTETQGASNFFTRGVEFTGIEIIGDENTPDGSSGIKIQGSYHPWFHDMNVNGMTNDGIEFTEETVGWAGTPNPDRYAIADAVIDRCNLSHNGRDGVRVENAACQIKVKGCYIVGNLEAGIWGHSSVHEISGSSISGNGTSGMSLSGGIVFLRHSVWGTPQNIHIHHNEIDANWNNQIFADTFMSVFEYNRFNDDPTWYAESSGHFLAPVQVDLSPSSGSDCRGNVVRGNSFRFTSVTDQNVTAVRLNLSVTDGSRQLKYNIVEGSRFSIAGRTSGVVTEYAEINGGSLHAVGNRWATIDFPVGSQKVAVATRSMATASGSQVIPFPFKPSNVELRASADNTEHQSVGILGIDGVDNGQYFYPTTPGWATQTGLVTIRMAAGDIYSGTAIATPEGLRIDWTRTGAPSGTINLLVLARP